MDLSQELALAEKLAKAAGQMAVSLQNNLTVTYKPFGQGPVTNADIALNNYIAEGLSQEFPHDRIIGEESYDGTIIGKGRCWFVDPIDGTASYLLKNDDFVIMIGLAIDGIARLGVVYQPKKHRLWRGIFAPNLHDSKAEKIENDKIIPLHRASIQKNPSDLIIIASRLHPSACQEALIKLLQPKSVQHQSSVGLKAMLIAQGEADLYVAWSKQINMWDTCAPTAILKAAQATITGLDGSELIFSGDIHHNHGIVVANFAMTKELLSLIEKIAK